MTTSNITQQKYTVTVTEGDTTVVTVKAVGPQGSDGTLAAGDVGDFTVSVAGNGAQSAVINSGAINNSKVADNAAIAGSKISPVFTSPISQSGSGANTFGANIQINTNFPAISLNDSDSENDFQIINANGLFKIKDFDRSVDVFTIEGRSGESNYGEIGIAGNILVTGDLVLTDQNPSLFFTEVGANPDYKVFVNSGNFKITDETNSADRFVINTDGHIDFLTNVDFASGIDVTGEIHGTSHLDLPNNAVLKLGDNDELTIFYNQPNGNSIIRETGNGILSLQTNGSQISFWDSTNQVLMAEFNTGGSCTFRHGVTTRLATSSTGINVTGNITSTAGLDVTGGDITGVLGSAVTGTTQSASDNSTKIATTSYVDTAVSNLVNEAPNTLNTLNELAAALGDNPNFATTVTNSIADKLPLAGGTLTGQLSISNHLRVQGFIVKLGSGSHFDGTLTNSDISNTAGIVGSKINPNFGSSTVVGGELFVGNTNFSHTKISVPTVNSSPLARIETANIIITGLDDVNTSYRLTPSDGSNQVFNQYLKDYGSGDNTVRAAVSAWGSDSAPVNFIKQPVLSTDSLSINDILYVNSENNRVGIGTTDPQADLHIKSASDCILMLQGDSGNEQGNEHNNPYILFLQDGSNQNSVIGMNPFNVSGENNSLVLANSTGSNGGIVFKTGTSAPYTNAVARMEIKTDGDVDITNNLQVDGTGTFDSGLTVKDASGSDPTAIFKHSNINVLGEVFRIARTDNHTIRYHSIKAQSGSDAVDNLISFHLHDGSGDPYTGQQEVLKLQGTKQVTVAGNLDVGEGVDVTGSITIPDATITDGIPNNAIKIGNATDGDLIIYHDSLNSYIQEIGTGNLFIDASYFTFRSGGGDTIATFSHGTGAAGGCRLHYGGASTPKLATSANGVDVTGNVVATGALRNSVPTDFWNTTNTFVDVGDLGHISTHGSYEFTLTSGGYRRQVGGVAKWKDVAIDGVSGFGCQVALAPKTGKIHLRSNSGLSTDDNNPDNAGLTDRLVVSTTGVDVTGKATVTESAAIGDTNLRKITTSTSAPTSSDGSVGDIWIVYPS